MIFNNGLPFKGFMEAEDEFEDFNGYTHTVRVPDSDISPQPLGGGSNSVDEEMCLDKDPVADLEEMNENLRKSHSSIVGKINSLIEFLRIDSKVSNNLVVEFLENTLEDSVDNKELESKINKVKNPIERRLKNIED